MGCNSSKASEPMLQRQLSPRSCPDGDNLDSSAMSERDICAQIYTAVPSLADEDFEQTMEAHHASGWVKSTDLEKHPETDQVAPQSGGRVRSAGRRILVTCSGTRGDVQPIAALSVAMKDAGFVVKVSTSVDHVALFTQFNIDVVGNSFDYEKMVLEQPDVLKALTTGNVVKFFEGYKEQQTRCFPEDFARVLETMKEFKPDVIMSTSLDMYESRIMTRVLDIPMIFIGLQPVLPTGNAVSFMGEPKCLPRGLHRAAWTFMFYSLYKSHKDVKDKTILSLVPEAEEHIPTSFHQFIANAMHPVEPSLYGVSPELCPRQADWPEDLNPTNTGFWIIGNKQQKALASTSTAFLQGATLDELSAFIAAGPTPVYIGWGSMVSVSSEHMVRLAAEALKLAGQRGIILGGWASLSPELLAETPELQAFAEKSILFLKAAPHEWLFPQCAATVHHGGMGTTAAALRSGVPTVITPCAFDQFNNARIVERSGAGIAMQQFSKVTPVDLSKAIIKCVTNEDLRQKAAEMGKKLVLEDGPANAVQELDKFFIEEMDTGRYKERAARRKIRNDKLSTEKAPSLSWFLRKTFSSKPNDYHAYDYEAK